MSASEKTAVDVLKGAIDKTRPEDSLTLKWGTLKGWRFHSDKGRALLKEYFDEGASAGAMTQNDTPRQREIICALIDEGNFETVYLDWDGEHVSKDRAKEYVMSFGAKAS